MKFYDLADYVHRLPGPQTELHHCLDILVAYFNHRLFLHQKAFFHRLELIVAEIGHHQCGY